MFGSDHVTALTATLPLRLRLRLRLCLRLCSQRVALLRCRYTYGSPKKKRWGAPM